MNISSTQSHPTQNDLFAIRKLNGLRSGVSIK